MSTDLLFTYENYFEAMHFRSTVINKLFEDEHYSSD